MRKKTRARGCTEGEATPAQHAVDAFAFDDRPPPRALKRRRRLDWGAPAREEEEGGARASTQKYLLAEARDLASNSGSDEEEEEEEATGSGRGERAKSNPGSDEEEEEEEATGSGRGERAKSADSEDGDEQQTCACCLRVMAPAQLAEVMPKCRHRVCQGCWDQARDSIEEGPISKKLEERMSECCGLSRRVCLKEWKREDLTPVRVVELYVVAELKTNVPKENKSLHLGTWTKPGKHPRIGYTSLQRVASAAIERELPLISRDQARDIGIKPLSKGSEDVKIQFAGKMCVGFPGYHDNRRHPKTLEVIDPTQTDYATTNRLFRTEGLGSLFDTKTQQYLPLEIAAGDSRIRGEAPFLDDGGACVACDRCGKWFNEGALNKLKCGAEAKKLFNTALEEPSIGVFCCAMSKQGAKCNPNIVEKCSVYLQTKAVTVAKRSAPVKATDAQKGAGSAVKKKGGGPVKVEVRFRGPVVLAKPPKNGEALPSSKYASGAGTEIFKITRLANDLRCYRPFFGELSAEEQEEVEQQCELKRKGDAGEDGSHDDDESANELTAREEEYPDGALVRDFAEMCDLVYSNEYKKEDSNSWHRPQDEQEGSAPNRLCRVFVGQPKRQPLTPVFSDQDVYDFLQPLLKNGKVDVALAKRDPFDNDSGDKYDLASKCDGLEYGVGWQEPSRGQELDDAMAHILDWRRGTKAKHSQEKQAQMKASFEWNQLACMIEEWQLWPVAYGKDTRVLIKQMTLGRINRSAAVAQRASASLFKWRATMQEAKHKLQQLESNLVGLGDARKSLWKEMFPWTEDSGDWNEPFR